MCVYIGKHLEHLENNINSIKGNDLGIGHNYQSFDYILSLNEWNLAYTLICAE